ncbi:hypothetical protein [Bradyrhizobium cenepequi]|uniref:hypothetical protein n=1 Tax=Bradyrhizobium cenepequi TaxID=2821403 RepID=UPI001CE2C86E|nr:hypothetical protein [Bradyrhizobium cenepequi]MCA6106107.1 hypothetical protein [Bradyrhizobium cenepequi]
MTTTTNDEVFDRYGRRTRRRDEIVEDGKVVSVPMRMMDAGVRLRDATSALKPHQRDAFVEAVNSGKSVIDAMADAIAGPAVTPADVSAAGHKPGFGVLDASAATNKERLRDERNAKLSNAWRNPPAIVDQQQVTTTATTSNAMPTHAELIAARDKRISEAWAK